jgi:hypothetical protein
MSAVPLVLGYGATASGYDRTYPATNGVARWGNEPVCWSSSYGRNTNVCSSTRELDLPIAVDLGGNGFSYDGTLYGAVYADGSGYNGSRVGCQLFTVSADGGYYWTSSLKYTTGSSINTQLINTGGAYFSGATVGTTAYIACYADSGRAIMSYRSSW